MADRATSISASEDTLASRISDLEDDLMEADHLSRVVALAAGSIDGAAGAALAHVAWHANAAVDRLKAQWRQVHDQAVREGGAA